MKVTIARFAMWALLGAVATSAHATVVVQNLGGPTVTPTNFYYGESFLTPADFLYYNLTFNFYSNVPATTPSAAGTAFLLTQPYNGTPSALSMTTPGFLTESTSATGGVYTFNPNFVLLTSTEYYLYSNAPLIVSGNNLVANEQAYFSSGATTAFISTLGGTNNFTLNGTRIGVPLVPEPSPKTALYVLSGAVGLGFVVMRRRRKVA